MTASSINLLERKAYAGTPALIFWIVVVSLLPVAALLGGMRFVLIAVAVYLSVIVYKRPQEAPGAGMLFLFAAGILLPFSARFYGLSTDMSEMYYWASGLLLITAAAVARIGLRRIIMVPRSAQVFFVVAVAAAVYGVTHGATMSYALRQFYGISLLVVYLGIAWHAGNEELLIRRMATFGVLCALVFFAYYIAVFTEYGFHKEMGYNGTQASFLAIVLFLTGFDRKKRLWIFGGIVLLGVPALLFMRRDVLTFLLAVPIAAAMKLRSRASRFLCYSAIALIALPAFFPAVTQIVADQLEKVPVIEKILPEGARDASSLYDRTVQLATALLSVKAHPWLGDGLGAGFEFESSVIGSIDTVYVDNGWAYLLQKTGLIGAAGFLWLLITMLTGVSRRSIGLSACLLAAALLTMFSEPVFVHFTTAPFMGTFAGLLLARKYPQPTREAVISSALGPQKTVSPLTGGI
jgi:hypothetical protein